MSFLSLCIDLPILNISHKWNHTICGLSWWPRLYLASCFQRSSILLHNNIPDNIPFFVHSTFNFQQNNGGCLGRFHLLAIFNSAAWRWFCASRSVQVDLLGLEESCKNSTLFLNASRGCTLTRRAGPTPTLLYQLPCPLLRALLFHQHKAIPPLPSSIRGSSVFSSTIAIYNEVVNFFLNDYLF